MKLLVRAPMIESDLNRLKKYFDTIVYNPWTDTGERYYENEMIEVLLEEKPDGLITELDEITEKVLKSYDGLKFVGDCRATPENIDTKACERHGVPLLCTPGRNAQAVAELWMASLIGFFRKLPQATTWMEEGNWITGTTPYYLFRGNELYGKHIGFVGMGAVPRTILRLLDGFNCRISYYDPFIKEEIEGAEAHELDYIFANCDIVSIHLPSNKNTDKMIGASLLKLMKKESIFINSSRASVVNEKDLYNILKNGEIKGAIIDVFNSEPLVEGKSEYEGLTNVLLTPHIFGASYEVVDHQSRIITDQILALVEKK